MERHFISETGANNAAIGYNLSPRWTGGHDRTQSNVRIRMNRPWGVRAPPESTPNL